MPKEEIKKLLRAGARHALAWRDFLLDIIFPIECLGCGREGAWLCRKCFRKLEFNNKYYCLDCKKITAHGEFCPDCREQQGLDGILIAGNYENEILAKLIKTMKYKFVRHIAPIIGDYISIYLREVFFRSRLARPESPEKIFWQKNEKNNFLCGGPAGIIIVPVPLAKKRRRWRGFNQSADIAAIIAENYHMPYEPSALLRIKDRKPQAKLARSDRLKNLAGCFAWQGPPLANKTVLLIDDVATTGATLKACAKELKKHGAPKVWGLVTAHG